MSANDHALVVGISRYPRIRDQAGQPAHLDGPDNDAQTVYDWLVDPAGGDVPAANVHLIRSAQYPANPQDPNPAYAAIRGELDRLVRLGDPAGTLAYDRIPAGRRLYVYMSGHGFAPAVEKAALFTADADVVTLTNHVYVNAWLEWFREGGWFEEFVLWMDCCMHPATTIVPEVVNYRRKKNVGTPGPAFVGLAARAGSALEAPMPDGKVHGVFTWALLQGLRHEAAIAGRVTGESLRDYLYNGLKNFIPEERRDALDVDLRPYLHADPGLEFAAAVPPPQYSVRLQFAPAAEAQDVRIWAGSPPRLVETGPVLARRYDCRLPRALYVVDVPSQGLRQGFEVTGSPAPGEAVEVAVAETGAPVQQGGAAAGQFSLDVSVENPAATVSVVDHQFERVLRSTGTASSRQPAGVYKLRAQFSRDVGSVVERIVLLDSDLRVALPSPPLLSPAPIEGTERTHEYHVAALYNAGQTLPTGGLSIMARYWTDRSRTWASGLRFPHPFTGLSVRDADGRPIPIPDSDVKYEDRTGIDPYAFVGLPLDAGCYFVSHEIAGGRSFEQAVHVVGEWETHVALLRTNVDAAPGGGAIELSDIGQIAVLMRRPNAGDFREDAHLVEAARVALVEDENLLAPGRSRGMVEDLLLRKFENPITGILGAHLLLRAAARVPAAEAASILQALDEVVFNLRRLVGDQHPDVEALSLRAPDAGLRTTRAFSAPPMFRPSWNLMVEASMGNPKLVPEPLWERVRAMSAYAPYLIWAADTSTRDKYEAELRSWVQVVAQLEAEETPRVSFAAAPRAPAPPPRGSDRAAGSEGGVLASADDAEASPASDAGEANSGLEALESLTVTPAAPSLDALESAKSLGLPAGAIRALWAGVRSPGEGR